jgi:hypothetical protein
MVNVTLDAIIRRYLALNQLPLHYYVPMLVIAKQGLEEMHFDTLGKVKHVVLTASEGYQITLPTDYVEAVMIGQEFGDKVRPMGYDRNMNSRDNDDTAFDQYADQLEFGPTSLSTSPYIESYFNEYGNFLGKQFGRNVVWEESYTVNREEGFIRLNNKLAAGIDVHLIYLSLPEKVSNQSVVHPFAQRSLIEFIGWQKSVYFKEKDTIQYKRNEYYNEYRKLRARLNKMTTVEIKRAVRRNVNLAVKG